MAAGLWTTLWRSQITKDRVTLNNWGPFAGLDELHFYKTRYVPETHVQMRVPGAQRPFGTYFLGQSQLHMVCYVIKTMYPDSWSANLTSIIRSFLFTNRLTRKKRNLSRTRKTKVLFHYTFPNLFVSLSTGLMNPFQEGAQQLLTDAYTAGNSEQSRKEKSDSALAVHIRRRNLSCREREVRNLYCQVGKGKLFQSINPSR